MHYFCSGKKFVLQVVFFQMKKSLIALAFGTLGLGIAEFTMMGILPYVAADLNISIPVAGHFISAYALGVCAGAPMLILARKRPLKHILLALMALMLVGNLGAAVAPDYWLLLAALSFFMLSRSGKKEGIDFKRNKWILFIVLAAVTGAVSGLYDKYLMKQLPPMVVQSWYNIYQVFIMCPIILLLWYPKRKESTPFRWDWTIIGISVFLCAADFVYFYALSYEDSMISIVSMVRRGSVVVSFLFGALFFREKNLKSKAADLILVLIGMFFLYLGSK